MTLAAVKKLAIRLTPSERLKLADALLDSIPPLRAPVSLAELEARVDEAASGRVKAVTGEVFDRELAAMEKSIGQRRPRQRG